MRQLLALAALLPLAACASGPPREWEKAGTDREMARQDLGECRRAASAEALRIQYDGFVGFSHFRSPYYGRGGYFFRQQRADSDRFYNESRLTNFCMHNKGYELNLVQTDGAPVTSPPPPRSP